MDIKHEDLVRAIKNVKPNGEFLLENLSLIEVLEMTAMHAFLQKVPESEDVELIRQALLNLKVRSGVLYHG